MTKPPLTALEAAQILNLSPGYIVNTLIHEGVLPATKDSLRRCWLIDAEAVAKYQPPNPTTKRPQISTRVSSKSVLQSNRDRLNEVMAEANPTRATYYLRDGLELSYIQWLVRQDERRLT